MLFYFIIINYKVCIYQPVLILKPQIKGKLLKNSKKLVRQQQVNPYQCSRPFKKDQIVELKLFKTKMKI
jgi:hypothetical protein